MIKYSGRLDDQPVFSDELKGDREVVLEAVKNDVDAFYHASDEMKGNKELALMVVKTRGRMIEYISNELKGEEEFLLTLFEYLDENLCAEAFKFIQPHLMNDEHFLFKMIQLKHVEKFFMEYIKNEFSYMMPRLFYLLMKRSGVASQDNE